MNDRGRAIALIRHARGRKFCLSILGFLVSCLLLTWSPESAHATTDPTVLFTQGRQAFQQGAFEEAIFFQRARLAILQRYAYPGYRAPFLLINNWL